MPDRKKKGNITDFITPASKGDFGVSYLSIVKEVPRLKHHFPNSYGGVEV
jgi:hypothetical protein